MSIELVMPSHHLILCCPLLLLPSIFPSIKVFSNESALHIRWPKYWSFSISPSNEYSGLISFKIDWLYLLAVQGTLQESSPTPQLKSINSSALSLLYGPTLTSIHDYWKNHILGSADSEIWILLATTALTVQKVKEAFSSPHSPLSKTYAHPEFLWTYIALAWPTSHHRLPFPVVDFYVLCPTISGTLSSMSLYEHVSGCGWISWKEKSASVKIQVLVPGLGNAWGQGQVFMGSSYSWKPTGWLCLSCQVREL